MKRPGKKLLYSYLNSEVEGVSPTCEVDKKADLSLQTYFIKEYILSTGAITTEH
ncbi:MAG: hypothetical protein WKF59_11615 [Chitinophagaceae bacterium]